MGPRIGKSISLKRLGNHRRARTAYDATFFTVRFRDVADDVVGAIPVHLFAGIWGTLIVAWTGDATFVGQLVGVLLTMVWVSAASAVVWLVLKYTIGVRPSEEEEVSGLDHAEIGVEAYPEFAQT